MAETGFPSACVTIGVHGSPPVNGNGELGPARMTSQDVRKCTWSCNGWTTKYEVATPLTKTAMLSADAKGRPANRTENLDAERNLNGNCQHLGAWALHQRIAAVGSWPTCRTGIVDPCRRSKKPRKRPRLLLARRIDAGLHEQGEQLAWRDRERERIYETRAENVPGASDCARQSESAQEESKERVGASEDTPNDFRRGNCILARVRAHPLVILTALRLLALFLWLGFRASLRRWTWRRRSGTRLRTCLRCWMWRSAAGRGSGRACGAGLDSGRACGLGSCEAGGTGRCAGEGRGCGRACSTGLVLDELVRQVTPVAAPQVEGLLAPSVRDVFVAQGVRSAAAGIVPVRAVLRGVGAAAAPDRGSRRTRRRCPVRSGDRARSDQSRRLRSTPGPRIARDWWKPARMLNLRAYRRRPGIMHHGQLLRRGPGIDSPAPAVVTDAVAAICSARVVVDIVNNRRYLHLLPTVIVNRAIVPISAIIATARISETIVHAAIVANVRTPVARVPDGRRRCRNPTRAASRAHPHRGPRPTRREPSNIRHWHSSQ